MTEPTLPVIRRVMPSIIARDIKGVAPMKAPNFSIAAFRSRAMDRLMESGMTFEEALEKVNERPVPPQVPKED
jgi:hypothetical protein